MNHREQKPTALPTAGLIMISIIMAFCIGPRADAFAQQNGPDSSEIKRAPIHSASTQFLILKTGSVYSGQLEFGGGKYVIHGKNGSSVRFRQGEVDFVTQSLNDAYNRLYVRVEPGDVIGHQRLANWCLKNRQVKAAQQQLAVLKNLTQGSKITNLLERQINELANPRTTQTPATNAQNASHEIGVNPVPENGIRRLPTTATRLASHAELQTTVDSFSRESLRDFNRSVHSRIVNGCAAARCHGDPDNPLRLWRIENQGGIESTGVRRNLHAITQYLDRQDPMGSKLLTYISEVHGEMDAPAYETTSHHYHAIKAWILSTGQQTQGTLTDQADSVSQTSFVDGSGQPRHLEMSNQLAAPPTLPSDILNPGNSIPSPIDLSKEEKRFVPRDEFDPAIFNRKFAKRPADTETPVPPATPASNEPFNRTTPLPPVSGEDRN